MIPQSFKIKTQYGIARKLQIKLFTATQETQNYLICVPGGPGGDSRLFEPQVAHFLSYTNVVLFDPRGCHQSDECTSAEYEMTYLIEDVESIFRHIEAHFDVKQWIVLGASCGSMTATGYAIKYATSPAKLVLVNGALSHEFIAQAVQKTRRLGSPSQQAWLKKLITGQISNQAEFGLYMEEMISLYSKRWQDTVKTREKPTLNVDSLNIGFNEKGYLHFFDWRNELHKIRCPVLILVGQDDFITPAESLDPQGLIANYQFHIIEGAHFLSVDNPIKYYGLIREFVTTLPS